MKERPILFSAPMVRAILSGTKTQTRRVAKCFEGKQGLDAILKRFPNQNGCPYGQPGDRLWVRETWNSFDGWNGYFYAADEHMFGIGEFDDPDHIPEHELRWRPSIHMPRAASRITLEITGVRVERLQDISEADAVAEGCLGPDEDVADNLPACPQCNGTGLYTAFNPATGGALPDTDCRICDTPVKRYRLLWESINGLGSWDSNPFVWVVEFKRATPTPEAS